MVQHVMRIFFLCTMGLLLEMLNCLEAEPGENITMWCQHELRSSGYIYWYKHTSSSAPRFLKCKYFTSSGSSAECYNPNENNGMVMSVENRNTSLTITAVDLLDSAHYYCGYKRTDGQEVTFSKSTYLHVRERNESISEPSDRAEERNESLSEPSHRSAGFISAGNFFMLVGGFGAVVLILLIILIIFLIYIIMMHRKTDLNTEAQANKDENHDLVIYAALHFYNKNMVDPHDVYSSALYQKLL
ncbi:uncharacterized protein LOC134335087 [Trichomycterus rosablanca]|uniref:uncharacterized protein LOC134335087 n=1 Tax=Trichomycterus rosablanca TaxID=2290929 RepID=UPI002F35E961